MPGYKTDRIASDIQRELASILPSIKDPRVSKLLSIVKVDVSSDLSLARVYISSIEGTEATLSSVKGLASAEGFIKRELSKSLKLRKMPELKFIADDSIAHSAHIMDILNSLKDDQ